MSADLMVFDKSKVPAERLLSRNMNIEIYHLLEGADQAQGLAVVIDVFRAFSLECYLFSRGVQKIYAVGREETAWELKREHPEYLMAGERGGVILPGFDYGNSPSQTEHADFRGKILIHTTSAQAPEHKDWYIPAQRVPTRSSQAAWSTLPPLPHILHTETPSESLWSAWAIPESLRLRKMSSVPAISGASLSANRSKWDPKYFPLSMSPPSLNFLTSDGKMCSP